MTRSAHAAVAVAAAVLLTLTGSGCSDNNGSKSSSTPTPSTSSYGASASPSSSAASATTAAATVAVGSGGKLGSILVDGKGRTLYLFLADKSTKSTCSGSCAAAWPPLLTSGAATAGTGAKTALLGTSSRSDGTTQVTYNGHPLYYYAGDTKAGDTNGQNIDGFGAEWYVLNAAGNKVEGS